MSIVFSGIAPHPPIIIPPIGQENLEQLSSTISSFDKLNQNLIASKAKTLVIISPHGAITPGTFTINDSANFNIDFEEFGDFVTKMDFTGDSGIAKKVKKAASPLPAEMMDEGKLDHGCGVPLYYLSKNIPDLKIVPVYFTDLSLADHFQFGKNIGKALQEDRKRIAVLASGDLSHRLDKNAPAGYSPKGKKFDNKLIEFLNNKKNEELLGLNENLIAEAGECGLRSIIILMGILEGLDYEPQVLSYEGPFGVGYLTMNFNINK